MGHALGCAIQDTMIRRARMMGKTTAFIPGCDHAGISTQSVVEKMLWRREKKNRHDIGREALVNTIWAWKSTYHKNITDQIKRMGVSVDWSREAFTMDENLSAAVRDTFIQLHDEGIIYRANRLVNWCTALNTSLSNLEVDNLEVSGRQLLSVPSYEKKIEFGVLTHFCYEIEGSDRRIEVATTRPETMLGDTGIAVHPKDSRYIKLVGKHARHPFLGRRLSIFADEHVDPEFGTGAVKITPAHDPNDFLLGKKHDLAFINILNDDGTLNSNTGDFRGMKRFDARYKVVEALKEKGLYVKWTDNAMKIPLCSKSKDVIEPIMKPQWWMKMDSLVKPAVEVVRNGTIKIQPESAEKNFFAWMGNLQDWCLSRQLWWGHRAPAYFVEIEGETGDSSDGSRWVCAQTEADARSKAEHKFPGKNFTLRWDEDVLDTWFSSGLWPFSTLGWPKKTQDMKTLYPTSILETGWDILPFWVARMIMLGVKLTGQAPFTEVYCHSLIRDSEGRKMSKSLGNVVDPKDIVDGVSLEDLHAKLSTGNLDPREVQRAKDYQKHAFPRGISECGADALRFALVNYTTGGGDIAFDIKVIEAYRRFANKIYQATNFVKGRLGEDFVPSASMADHRGMALAERWILHRLNVTAQEVNESIENREFSTAASILYQYWLTQLCDTFIENSKFLLLDHVSPEQQASAKQTLYIALEAGLRLLHPIMPFVTEHLWQKLPRRPNDPTEPSIMTAAYPQYIPEREAHSEAANYEFVMALAAGIRSLLSQYSFKEPGEIIIQTHSSHAFATAVAEKASISALGGKNVGKLTISQSLRSEQDQASPPSAPAGCAVSSINEDAAVYLKIVGRVDLAQEKSRAEQSRAEAQAKVDKSRKIMQGEGWGKVKSETREKEEKNLRDAEAEVERYEEVMRSLDRLKLEEQQEEGEIVEK